MFLLRDGTTIPDGYLTKVGKAKYSENELNEEQFKELVKLGCLYLSTSGYYSTASGYGWRQLGTSYQSGEYWVSTIRDENHTGYYMYFDEKGEVSIHSSSYNYRNYRPVRLIKPAY
jgi:hypothetical protein